MGGPLTTLCNGTASATVCHFAIEKEMKIRHYL